MKILRAITLVALCCGSSLKALNITERFEQTWTAIAAIEEQLCEKFEGTWTTLDPITEQTEQLFTTATTNIAVLNELFEGTWTVIDDINQTLCTKFQETWTALDEIGDAAAQVDVLSKFEQTWTVIDGIEQELCGKFDATWTVLAGLEDIIDQAFAAEISSGMQLMSLCDATATVIADLIDTVTNKFIVTWTIIDALRQEVSFSLRDEFEQTWTAIDGVQEGVCRKFEELWVTLQNNNDELAALALLLGVQVLVQQGQFEQTWTIIDGIQQILCDKFEATWTALSDVVEQLEDVQATLENEVAVVWEELDVLQENQCQKFEDTWTILADISNQLSSISASIDFQTVFTAIKGTSERLCEKFEQTWEIIGCDVGIPITGVTTINSPGTYCLVNDISVAVGDVITVDADNVVIDMNNYRLSNASFSGNAICVMPGHSNVTVQNGTIFSFPTAIQAVGTAADPISKITVENMCFIDCPRTIDFEHVITSEMRDWQSVNTVLGIDTQKVTLRDCVGVTVSRGNISGNTSAAASTEIGIVLVQSCTGCLLEEVDITNDLLGVILESGRLFGSFFEIDSCFDCSLIRCGLRGDAVSTPGQSVITAGISLRNTLNSKVLDCSIQGLRSEGTGVNAADGVVGFYVDDASFYNLIEGCFAGNISFDHQGAASPAFEAFAVGFEIDGDHNIVRDCIAQNIFVDQTNARDAEAAGFRLGDLFGDFDDSVAFGNKLINNLALRPQVPDTTAATGMAYGFVAGDGSASNEFKECQALYVNSEDGDEFGFRDFNTSSSNAYIRCLAVDNGVVIGNQFSGGGAALATWVATKATGATAMPAHTAFSSLGALTV